MDKYLLVAARDPGAANVLTGFLSTWNDLPKERIQIWAMGKAAPLLTELGLETTFFEENVSESELDTRWKEAPPAAVLTGSSHYTPFEAHLWSLAKRDHIEALCWIDYWSHLGERFRFGRPPRVVALDTGQAQQLQTTGFSADQIMVGGHPGLAKVAERVGDNQEKLKDHKREGALRCLFVSERFYGDVSDGLIPDPGFDEVDSFKLVYQSALDVAQEGYNVELTVKFHPYEDPTRFREKVKELPTAPLLQLNFLPPQARLTEILPDHDLVFGMCSIGLIEALMLGIPAKSVQPNRNGTELFPPAASGFVPSQTDPDRLVEECRTLLRDHSARRELLSKYTPFLDSVSSKPTEVIQWVHSNLAY